MSNPHPSDAIRSGDRTAPASLLVRSEPWAIGALVVLTLVALVLGARLQSTPLARPADAHASTTSESLP